MRTLARLIPLGILCRDALTLEDIVAALQAIVDEAAGSPDGMTAEQADRYEDLERQLLLRQRTEQILTRSAGYGAIVPGTHLHVGGGDANDGAELDRAFESYIRTGRENADLMELRAQETGTPSEGGYLIPEGFRQKLVERLKAFGGILSHVENISTSSGATIPWPTVDDTANLGEIVAEEAAPAGGADIVLGQADIGAHKFMSAGAGSLPLRVSWELLADSAFDVEALLARLMGRRIARKMALSAIRGTGTGDALGLVYGTTPTQPAANTGWTYDDLINFVHALDPDYRDGAAWAFNDLTLATIQKMKDSHGDPIWRPDTGDMATALGGGSLLGYPVIIDQGFVDLVIADSTAHCGAFGNFEEAYVWRTVRDFTLIVDPYARKLNGQNEYLSWARADGTVQNPNAYVTLSGKS